MHFAPHTKRILIWAILGWSLTANGQPPQKLDPVLASLVESERTFARTCVAQGVRASFLAFFADDAIIFWPHPVKAREQLLQQPAPAERPPVTLDWLPVRAEVARAGDLGYTTGPTLTTDDKQNHKPVRAGYYFSIWRRQPDGTWKVELDVGIKTPLTNSLPAPNVRIPAAQEETPAKNESNTQELLLAQEKDFAAHAKHAANLAAAFGKLITDDAQLNHDGHFPLIGRNAIQAYLTEQKFSLQWEPIKVVVASSNDFAYSYGKYLRQEMTSLKKGYYVHVWRRNTQRQWKLSVEVLAAPLADKE